MTQDAGPRRIRLTPESDRLLIVGSTGDGKSTIARHVVESFQPCRTIICDSKRDIAWPRSVLVRTPAEISRAAAAGAHVIRWVPAAFDKRYLEECWIAIHELVGPLIVWVDEAAEHCAPNRCPTGLRLDITQGRSGRNPHNPQDEKRGPKLMVICTQRINECHPVVRTQAEHIMVMTPPPAEIDLRAIAGTLRRKAWEIEEELKRLLEEHGRFSHLWYVKPTDELRRMAPIPLSTRPRRVRRPVERHGYPLPHGSEGV